MIRILLGLTALLALCACSSDYNSEEEIHEALERKYTAEHMDAVATFRDGAPIQARLDRDIDGRLTVNLADASVDDYDLGAIIDGNVLIRKGVNPMSWDGNVHVEWLPEQEVRITVSVIELNTGDESELTLISYLDTAVGVYAPRYISEPIPMGWCEEDVYNVQFVADPTSQVIGAWLSTGRVKKLHQVDRLPLSDPMMLQRDEGEVPVSNANPRVRWEARDYPEMVLYRLLLQCQSPRR